MSDITLKITIDDGSLTVEIQQHISLEAAHRVLFPRGDHAELLERP